MSLFTVIFTLEDLIQWGLDISDVELFGSVIVGLHCE
jgi:hypothetical protein